MWPLTFEARLSSWICLRDSVALMPIDQCLRTVNSWWFAAPWRAYYLHWDDCDSWPDPWQLLDDNFYCGLARGLGIMYTICLLDRLDIVDACLIDTGSDNLVLVGDEKYILNWERDQILNINLPAVRVRHRLAQEQIKTRIK